MTLNAPTAEDYRKRRAVWLLVVLLPLSILSVVRAVRTISSAAEPIDTARPKRLIERDGRRYLFGGEREEQHFDVTEFRLEHEGLHYGLGREAFPALIAPTFQNGEKASQWLHDHDKVLTVNIGDTVRVYPVRLLTRHEVVNDTVEGVPIFAAYCVLADLGAIYDRRVGGHTLTFGVAGYTYSDPDVWDGRDTFVLWDRESESLWWPPIGRAVAGPLIDRPLPLLDERSWSQSTWGASRHRFPSAQVLAPGQRFTPPEHWPRLRREDFTPDSSKDAKIAPRWSESATAR